MLFCLFFGLTVLRYPQRPHDLQELQVQNDVILAENSATEAQRWVNAEPNKLFFWGGGGGGQ